MIDNCFLFQSDISLFHTVIKWGAMCFRTVSSVSNIELLNSKDCIKVLGKEKESPCLVVLSSTKREISHFYGLVVQRQQRNVQESVMHMQSCCFANLNLLLFFLFWLLSRSLLPKLPNAVGKTCLSYLQLPSLETYFSPSICPHIKTSGALFQRFQSQWYSYLWRAMKC